MLKVWAESHSALRDVVVKHLGNLAMTAVDPDFSGNQFQGVLSSVAWRHETDKILEHHDEFDKNDIALMLCYVSGKRPTKEKDGVLSQSLEYLESLPPNAPEWGETLPSFVEEVKAIIKAKKAQYKQANDLDALIIEVKDVFSSELEFLEKDIASWSAAHLSPDADLSTVLRDTQKMQSLLTEYQPILKPAPVLKEERERRPKRTRLENRLLSLIDRIDPFMSESRTPPIEAEQQSDVPAEEQPAQTPNDQRAFSEKDYSALKAKQEKEIKSLQRELRTTEKMVEMWRVAYIDARASKEVAIEGEDEVLSIDRVNDAVELAKKRFDDKLLFQLNGKSRVEDNPFKDPKAVWDALQWLATTYYESRLGEIKLTNLDVSVRKACKWWYKRRQSKRTMKKYEEWYTTKVDNRVYWLERHIGTGSNKDARYTIRVAFDWDESKKRVVIGFIGQHQQTDAT